MDVARLAEAARGGDVDAFTELVRRYQAMAFGYAYATTRDFDLAEDAAQQAFVTAWRTLASLRQPERFGGWLRGIIRFECLHLLRRQRPGQVPLDLTLDVADDAPGPAALAESRDGLVRVLAAINALPEAERVSATLYYIHDHTQREVADFLNLPVSTVNNRLRTARTRLREGDLLTMATDAFRSHPLPDDFANRIGAVVRAEGPIVEARFDSGKRPPVLNRVTITDTPSGRALTAQVAQYLNDDLVRCIVLDGDGAPPASGATVRDLAEPATLPLDLAAVGRVVDRFVRPESIAAIAETGIKAIDVTCPIPAGGLVALIGDMQVGKMVLVEELIHRLDSLARPITILVFVEATTEVGAIQQLEYRTSGPVQAVYLPVADASPEALASVLGRFDTVICLARELGKQGLYPAIDPLHSTSRLLDSGDEAVVAQALNTLLRDAPDSARAHLVRRYLSQPFYVAEPFTNRPGATVPRETALADLRALLAGEHADLEPNALYMTGALGAGTG